MKKIVFSIAVFCSANFCFGQNTFPATGNVGIGTSAPTYPFQIKGTSYSTRFLEGTNQDVKITPGTTAGKVYINTTGDGTTGPAAVGGQTWINFWGGQCHIGGNISAQFPNTEWQALNVVGKSNFTSDLTTYIGAFKFKYYGGGITMTDNTWIRTINDKSIWTNAGLLGTNGGITSGYGGTSPNTSGGAIIAGSVGIGNSTPSYKLDVNGDIAATGWLRTRGSAGWYSESYGGGWYMSDATWIRSYNNKNVYVNTTFRTDGRLEVGGNGGNFVAVAATGNVGINNSNPTSRLDVSGTGSTGSIARFVNGSAEAMRIDPTYTWVPKLCVSVTPGTCPDYVFEDEYELRSIEDLAIYVKENKHLPNVPSAKEIDKKGSIDIQELSYSMLEKIEELSLYIIQMKKENTEMRKENTEMKRMFEANMKSNK